MAVVGIPDDVDTFAMMPIGYPEGKFGPVVRRLIAEVAYTDRWSRAWSSVPQPPLIEKPNLCVC